MSPRKAARILAPAAAALAVGLVALAATHHLPQAAAAASAPVTAISWADHPAAIPAASTTRNPGIAACDSRGLRVRLERRGLVQPGTYAYVYGATNTTSHACYVSGLPSVKLAGKAMASGPNVLSVAAGVLAPGASASFAITTSARASCTPAVSPGGVLRTSAVAPRVQIGAQPGAAVSAGTVLLSTCAEVAVSQIGLTPAEPAPDLLSPLTVRLQAPASARAGDTLRFTVSITNPTRAAIRLSPCPAYEVGISTARPAAYELNCSTPVIGAGQTRSYDMQYTVPASTPAGPAKIGWFLLNSTRTGAGGFITITR
jgi:hypothetical protein